MKLNFNANEKDLLEICEFIGQTNVNAASKLFDSIRQKCKLVETLYTTSLLFNL